MLLKVKCVIFWGKENVSRAKVEKSTGPSRAAGQWAAVTAGHVDIMEQLRFIELLFVLVKDLKRALRSPCRLDTQLKEWQRIKERAVSDLLCCAVRVLFHVFYPRLPMRPHQSVHRYPAESHSYIGTCVYFCHSCSHKQTNKCKNSRADCQALQKYCTETRHDVANFWTEHPPQVKRI